MYYLKDYSQGMPPKDVPVCVECVCYTCNRICGACSCNTEDGSCCKHRCIDDQFPMGTHNSLFISECLNFHNS